MKTAFTFSAIFKIDGKAVKFACGEFSAAEINNVTYQHTIALTDHMLESALEISSDVNLINKANIELIKDRIDYVWVPYIEMPKPDPNHLELDPNQTEFNI